MVCNLCEGGGLVVAGGYRRPPSPRVLARCQGRGSAHREHHATTIPGGAKQAEPGGYRARRFALATTARMNEASFCNPVSRRWRRIAGDRATMSAVSFRAAAMFAS